MYKYGLIINETGCKITKNAVKTSKQLKMLEIDIFNRPMYETGFALKKTINWIHPSPSPKTNSFYIKIRSFIPTTYILFF